MYLMYLFVLFTLYQTFMFYMTISQNFFALILLLFCCIKIPFNFILNIFNIVEFLLNKIKLLKKYFFKFYKYKINS